MVAPGYGETPVPDDELEALHPLAREILDEPISKAAVYDLEQAVQAQVVQELTSQVLSGERDLENLLSDYFVRELHKKMYSDIWTWAGVYRHRELSIGIDPWLISVELRNSLNSILFRLQNTDDWSPRETGIAVHAEVVRIHPFADGNGRSTRLLADLVYFASQVVSTSDSEELSIYDWDVDKNLYISLLRRYDGSRNPADLAEFISVKPFEA